MMMSIKTDMSAHRRFIKDHRAAAAIEFAFIFPLLLSFFFGSYVLARGYYASQKVNLVAHNLADLTARTIECNGDATRACLSNIDMQDIFDAGKILMSPLPTNSLKMTISEVGVFQGNQGRNVQTSWSVTRNGEERACGGAPAMPDGFTAANAPLGAIIVVDVSYTFSPGFHYETLAWNKPLTWTFTRSHYAVSRNLAPAPANANLPNGHIRNDSGQGTNCVQDPP